jgi:hypothetical protein
LWPIDDEAATAIAADVYERLTGNGTRPLDATGAAHSLHQAVRALRARCPQSPARWGAHIHVGG